MPFSDSFFATKFGITERDLENYLSEALSRGGDYADLYFEYLATSSISIDESIVKSATQGVSLGLGVRVISGERTGYAYSDDLSPEKIRHAAQVAAMIAAGPAKVEKTPLEEGPRRSLVAGRHLGRVGAGATPVSDRAGDADRLVVAALQDDRAGFQQGRQRRRRVIARPAGQVGEARPRQSQPVGQGFLRGAGGERAQQQAEC